jgi:hypothetical protein
MPLPTLTARDRRTLRLAGMGLGAYLLFFCGWTTVNFLGQRRTAYRQLQREAADQKTRLELYDSRVVRLHRLMDAAQMDPAQLSKPRLVARASAAIQQAAMQGGLQMGPIRETLSRGTERELGSIQLEAAGQVTSLTTFLHRLGTLGFPVILDTVQFSSDPMRPGMIKISIALILLDYEQWDAREVPNA